LYAITGIITFSSNVLPSPLAAKAMVASLPITWAATLEHHLAHHRVTLPGMIELPGCVAGMLISPSPHRGPLRSQRMSLAILLRLTRWS
jgi:hypothetical protein